MRGLQASLGLGPKNLVLLAALSLMAGPPGAFQPRAKNTPTPYRSPSVTRRSCKTLSIQEPIVPVPACVSAQG